MTLLLFLLLPQASWSLPSKCISLLDQKTLQTYALTHEYDIGPRAAKIFEHERQTQTSELFRDWSPALTEYLEANFLMTVKVIRARDIRHNADGLNFLLVLKTFVPHAVDLSMEQILRLQGAFTLKLPLDSAIQRISLGHKNNLDRLYKKLSPPDKQTREQIYRHVDQIMFDELRAEAKL